MTNMPSRVRGTPLTAAPDPGTTAISSTTVSAM